MSTTHLVDNDPTLPVTETAKEAAQQKALRVDQRHRLTADEWAESGRWVRMKSSNVSGIAYDRKNNTLMVGFKDGSLYKYSNVPEVIAKGMFAADSAGRYVWRALRDRYPYERLTA